MQRVREQNAKKLLRPSVLEIFESSCRVRHVHAALALVSTLRHHRHTSGRRCALRAC